MLVRCVGVVCWYGVSVFVCLCLCVGVVVCWCAGRVCVGVLALWCVGVMDLVGRRRKRRNNPVRAQHSCV